MSSVRSRSWRLPSPAAWRLRLLTCSTIALGGWAASGCAGGSAVVRVYDGRIVEGAFVPAEAYSAYLRGVLAEEAGDLRAALAAYERASEEDDGDPEPLTKIGDTRCRIDPNDRRADESLDRALRIDRLYTGALVARARCAEARGRFGDAIASIDAVPVEDRASVEIEALFVRIAGRRGRSPADGVARSRAIALTLASAESASAWDALARWGRSKGDAEMFARGLEGLVRAAPVRYREVEAGATELLGLGQVALARRVAAKLVDAKAELGIGEVAPLVARLAIDAALLAGDAALAERRSVRGRVHLSEVAARALMLERPALADGLAREVAAADPSAGGAAMVLIAASARYPAAPSAANDPRTRSVVATDRPSAACLVLLVERVAASGNVAAARVLARRLAAEPMVLHDPTVGPFAVALAARGALDERDLPFELRIELAARRGEAPPPLEPSAIASGVVDAKHLLLWHSLSGSPGAQLDALRGRATEAVDRDPLVGFVMARAALVAPVGSEERARALALVRSWPSDPLLLALGVELVKRGPPAELSLARGRLFAVARTDAERSLASE